MSRYIVTDLTRFKNPDELCTAVVDVDTGKCLRPMPYFKTKKVQKLKMHPGAILDGQITPHDNTKNPHIEDAEYNNLKYVEPASSADFKAILERTLSSSVADGFGVPFANGQKYIPVGQQATCSIITIKIPPESLHIHEDDYKPGRIKASFTDSTGQSFRYLAITDKGFFEYAQAHQNDGKLDELQRFVNTQEELYLRLGVGRQWQDRYWLQVNGIYTFPDFLEEVRS